MRTLAERARDEAITRVSRPLTEEEIEAGALMIGVAAERLPEFTVDDVDLPPLPEGADCRAVAAWTRRAQAYNFIEATDRRRKSELVVCHARAKTVWRSLIYEPEA
jgi:hypothetical protein